MRCCDVLIVGAGPAGSTLAWALQDSGLDVILMDKCSFPRDKLCAGWVTPEVFSMLHLDPNDYARGHVCQPITGFKVGMLAKPLQEIAYHTGPLSFSILRREFDHYLLDRTKTDLILSQACQNLQQASDGWIVNGALKARLLVGAGGHFCSVARAITPSDFRRGPLLVCKEAEILLTETQQRQCNVQPQHPELFFCDDLMGYGWAVRKGDYLTIGLGREGSENFPIHMSRFVNMLTEQGKIPQATTLPFSGHAYLTARQSCRPLIGDRVLLIGDAAGLAAPRSGEGIRPAVDSALLAAPIILKASGLYDSAHLAPYAATIEARYGSRPTPGKHLGSLPGWLKRPMARALMNSPFFIRHVVLDRWFLQRNG